MEKTMKNRKEQRELWELMISRAVSALAAGVLAFSVSNKANHPIDLTSFLNIISFILLSFAFLLLISSLFVACFSSKSKLKFKRGLETLWWPFILLSLAGIITASIDNSQRSILVILAFVFLVIFLGSLICHTLQGRRHYKATERVPRIKDILGISFSLGFLSMLLSVSQASVTFSFGLNIFIFVVELLCVVLLMRSMMMISKMFSKEMLWKNFKFNLRHFKAFLRDT